MAQRGSETILTHQPSNISNLKMGTTSKFDDRPFGYKETKSGSVLISYKNKIVTTLTGKQAAKFVLKASSSDEQSRQMLMAKATGQFRHGNEKKDSRA